MNSFEQLQEVTVPEGIELSYEKIVTSIRSLLTDQIFKNPNLEFFEKYSASKKGDVACGTICANGIGIHFTHSYNKQLKFQLSLVCYGKTSGLVYTTSAVKIHSLKKGDTLQTLLEDITAEIQDGKAAINFRGLREWMDRSMAWPKMINFVGYLFFNDGFLTPTQASALQTSLHEIKSDSNLFSENSINGMVLFKALINAIDETSPKVWLTQNRELYDIVMRGSDKPKAVETDLKEAAKEHGIIPLTAETKVEETPVQSAEEFAKSVEEFVEQIKAKTEAQIQEEKESTQKSTAAPTEESALGKGIKDLLEQKSTTHTPEVPVKKGLGLFSKITKPEVYERTGKTRNVIVQPESTEDKDAVDLDNDTPEEIAEKLKGSGIEVTKESVPVGEVNVTVTTVKIGEPEEDEFQTVDDAVDFDAEEEDIDLVDDDFDLEAVDLNDEIEEEEYIPIVTEYAAGNKPDITVQTETYTEYYVAPMNMTIVVDKEKES